MHDVTAWRRDPLTKSPAARGASRSWRLRFVILCLRRTGNSCQPAFRSRDSRHPVSGPFRRAHGADGDEGAPSVKRTLYGILALVLLLGAFLAGSWHESVKRIHDSTAAGRKIPYYVDPMHPAYKSDKPGIAPDCGMELVPVYEDGSMGGPGGSPRVRPEPWRSAWRSNSSSV